MTKLTFIITLSKKLSSLPQKDIEEHLNFYSEMIDDRIEEGLSEEDAVAAIGSIDKITEDILSENLNKKLVKQKIKSPRHLSAREIILIILGFPLWFPLIIATFAVIVSIFVSCYAAIISFWSVFVSVAAVSLYLLIVGIIYLFGSTVLSGIAMIGAALLCCGLSVFIFHGCKASLKGMLWLTKKTVILIKKCFARKVVA